MHLTDAGQEGFAKLSDEPVAHPIHPTVKNIAYNARTRLEAGQQEQRLAYEHRNFMVGAYAPAASSDC